MWIALRLVLAIVGLVIRLRHRRSQPKPEGTRDDTPYFVTMKKLAGQTVGFAIGMPLKSPAWIRLHRGTWANHLAKRLRVSSEVHTGDPKFDDDVYITCDHPAAPPFVAERADLRAAVIAALEAGYKRVQFDGSAVWMDRTSTAGPSETDLAMLAAIHRAAKPLEAGLPHRFADNFIWHALVLEILVWTILGYALAAFLRFYIRFVDIHVFRTAIALRAIPVALVLLALILFLVYRWMRGTPRGQLLIVESVAVLLVGLPIASIQVVADTNRALDSSTPTVVTRTFDHCESREHRRERATWYSHHVWLRDPNGEPALPDNIRVPAAVCAAGQPGDSIEITLGAGRWGVPYYRKIQIRGVTYEP
jgi:hypothetical protein